MRPRLRQLHNEWERLKSYIPDQITITYNYTEAIEMPTKKKSPEQEMADLEKNWYETAQQFGQADTTGEYIKTREESDEALDRWLDLRRELGDVALLEGMGTE